MVKTSYAREDVGGRGNYYNFNDCNKNRLFVEFAFWPKSMILWEKGFNSFNNYLPVLTFQFYQFVILITKNLKALVVYAANSWKIFNELTIWFIWKGKSSKKSVKGFLRLYSLNIKIQNNSNWAQKSEAEEINLSPIKFLPFYLASKIMASLKNWYFFGARW